MRALAPALVLWAVASAVHGQDAATAGAAALRPLCTDRPTKSTAPCTVDPGHLQIETDLLDFTHASAGGVSADLLVAFAPTVKLGLTRALDAEVAFTSYERSTISDQGGRAIAEGFGDIFARLKWNLAGDDGGKVAIALSPFVKLPTASHGLGNGVVEAGLIAPVNVNLPANWSITFDPEVDWLENSSGAGRHVAVIGLASLSRPLSKTLTGSVELWAQRNFDPAAETTQVTADLGLAWIPPRHPNFQLDGGANFGLDRAAPAAQVYIGASRRF